MKVPPILKFSVQYLSDKIKDLPIDSLEYNRFDHIEYIIKNYTHYEENFINTKIFNLNPIFPLQLEELSDWIADANQSNCYMRIIKNGNPDKIEDRRVFIEKTPRVFDPTLGIAIKNCMSWVSGPKGDDLYGLNPKSRSWADRYAKWIGYKI